MNNHYDVLKKLFPIDLGELADEDMKIEGQIFDNVNNALHSVLLEISPSTAVKTLGRWEKEFGVIPKTTNEAQRRNTVKARMRELASSSNGSLRKALFISIAEALGYTIEIHEAGPLFRAGISKAGDRVYSTVSIWIVTVVVMGVSGADDLEELFNDIFPPYIKIEFEYN